MRYEAEPAFVLHARPWRETSLLVEVLSEGHGRVGLLVGRRALLPRHRTLGGIHEVGQDVAGAPPGRPAHGRGELLVGRGPEEGDGVLGEVAVGHVGS